MPLKDRAERLAYNKRYYQKNHQRLLEYRRSYLAANRERCYAEVLEYRKKYRKELSAKQSAYQRANKDKVNKAHREYYHRRYNSDPEFKTLILLRSRVKDFLAGKKSKTTRELLGCSLKTLRRHIEAQFQEGMTWENHTTDGWHIDHIIPCCKFNLTDIEEQKKCFNYKNLQPLWGIDNLRKGGRI